MSEKILIIDDQVEVLEVLKETLEFGGYQVLTASSARLGLRQLSDYQPDLVITDMRMPDMDGFEFSRHVRGASDVPIVMLTGLGTPDMDVAGASLVDVYLVKPISITDLLAKVGSLLAGRT